MREKKEYDLPQITVALYQYGDILLNNVSGLDLGAEDNLIDPGGSEWQG